MGQHLRHFKFDPSRMGSKDSLKFEEGVKAVCGLQGSTPNSLLSSLPCELTFNSLRDSARRHSKQERQSPAAMHCVAWQSAVKHGFGCESIELTHEDWATPVGKGAVKSCIHSSLRTTASEMGISCEGLTKHRTNRQYTKPHVFTMRLDLLSTLSQVYKQSMGEESDRKAEVVDMHSKLWISKLFNTGTFVRQKGESENPTTACLVVRGGPHTVQCLQVEAAEIGYKVDPAKASFDDKIVVKIDSHEIALCQPAVNDQLVWKRTSGWMSLSCYVADHSILQISASLLSSLCAKMRLQGHARLDHRHRVELFLRHLNRDEAYINETLAQLPETKRKKRKAAEEDQELNHFCRFVLLFACV